MIKTKLGKAVIMLALIAILVAAIIYKHFLLPVYKDANAELTITENSLASTDMLMLSSIDLDFLRKLEAKLYGKATLPDLIPDTPKNNSLYSALQSALMLYPDSITYISAAAYMNKQHSLSFALVAGGRIHIDDVIKLLKSNAQAQPHAHIADAWNVQVQDVDSCQMSKIMTIIVAKDKIIALDNDNLQLLERLQKAAPAARDLTRWREFRNSRFIAAAAFLPGELPQQGIDPFVGFATQQVKQKLADFNEIYLGAGSTAFPPGGKLSLWLTTNNPAIAAEKASVWKAELAASRKNWGNAIPTLAKLHDRVKFKVSGNKLQTEVKLDKKLATDLGKLPAELISMMFSGMGMSNSSPQVTSNPPAEVIDKNPRKFTDQFNPALILPYDPKALFAEPAEVSVGPFGIQLAGVRLTNTDPKTLEIDVKALGSNFPNVSDNAESAMALSISSVRDKDGKELLRSEPCGRDRNSLAAHPSFSFGGGRLTATKKVRLQEAVRHADVALITGNVQLKIPTRIETVLISNPKTGDLIEREFLRIELTKVETGSISYRVSGRLGRLLHVQAKNSKGEFLASGSASSMSGGFNDAKSTTIEFKGKIASLEFVLAQVNTQKDYPFELRETHPQAIDAWLPDKPYIFEAYSKAEIKRISTQTTSTPKRYQQPVATAHSGPAIVDLVRVGTFGDMQLGLSLYTPLLKNMDGALSAVELEIQKITLADGTIHQPPDGQSAWRVPVSMNRNNKDDYVSGQTTIETGIADKNRKLAAVNGRLWLNIPLVLDKVTLPLTDVGAQLNTTCGSIQVTEISRSSITLEGSGDPVCLYAIRALNAEGKDMRVNNTDIQHLQQKWQVKLSVNGTPGSLELIMLKKSEQIKYPFKLSISAESAAH